MNTGFRTKTAEVYSNPKFTLSTQNLGGSNTRYLCNKKQKFKRLQK